MNRQEFLDTLSRNLYGKVNENVLTEHIRYYESYISSGIANGKTEQEVLEELGDPRWIAKTILDASKQKTSAEKSIFHKEGEEKLVFEKWKSKLIAAVIILIILAICIFVFRLVLLALPFIIIMAGVIWLIKKLSN